MEGNFFWDTGSKSTLAAAAAGSGTTGSFPRTVSAACCVLGAWYFLTHTTSQAAGGRHQFDGFLTFA